MTIRILNQSNRSKVFAGLLVLSVFFIFQITSPSISFQWDAVDVPGPAQNVLKDQTSDYDFSTRNGRCKDRTLENEKMQPDASYFAPSLEYEQTRRRLLVNVKELWNLVNFKIKSLIKKEKQLENQVEIQNALDLIEELKNVLLGDLQQLREVDGFEKWREEESTDLSMIVQQRFQDLQNPIECKSARKLLCSLKDYCGFGCSMHHLTSCSIVAYATNRTLILNSKNWSYLKSKWTNIFRPLSETCDDPTGSLYGNWQNNVTAQVLRHGYTYEFTTPQSLPMAIPHDLAPRLSRLHGIPAVWWVGQVLKYLLRLQPTTQEFVETEFAKLKIQHPIVGVHIRRTDKLITEAKFHSTEEYIKAVEEFYRVYEIRNPNSTERRIYVATDDPEAITELKKNYPNYIIFANENIAKSASLNNRYSETSLRGVLVDIYALSQTDFLVCTLSSTFCRVTYELMQTLQPDASDQVFSLDDRYFYAGGNPRHRSVVLPHRPNTKKELELRNGDMIDKFVSNRHGFSWGRNRRSGKEGIFPTFKTQETIEKFTIYSN